MKPCSYCGRENQDEAISCQECGTAFAESTSDKKPPESHPSGWLRYTLGCFGVFLAVICFYLLSLGPVSRCFGTVIRSPPVTNATTEGETITVSVTVTRSYPGWVALIYHPAFALEGSGAFGNLYAAYLQWWESR